ncbi:MAG: DUF11 domain-containing protein, partial [Gammaproteobacteria bacterium]
MPQDASVTPGRSSIAGPCRRNSRARYAALAFLITLSLIPRLALAQTGPGGIGAGMRLWLRADIGVTASATNGVTGWADQSPQGMLATPPDTAREPLLVNDAINFNPALSFNNDRVEIAGGIMPDAFVTDFNVYAVFADIGQGNRDFLISERVNDGLVRFDFNPGGRAEGRWRGAHNAEVPYPHNTNVSPDVPALIAGHSGSPPIYGLTGDRNQAVYIDGRQVGTGDERVSFFGNGSTFVVGASDNGGGAFDGRVSEVIVYVGPLSLAQHRRIESYLAIKYGITLRDTDYVDSAGNVIFDFAAAGAFANDIAGIGADAAGSLLQPRSRSSEPDSVVSIGGATDLQDGEFLMWGTDDNGVNAFTPLAAGGQQLERVDRTWRVVETGEVGAVDVQVDTADLPGLTLDPGDTYKLLIADNPGMANPQIIDLGAAPGMLTVPGVQLNDGQYFSFAVDGVVAAVDLAVTKTLDNASPVPGATVNYTVSVTNNGPGSATTVRVTDVLPAGVSYVPGTMTGGDARNEADPVGAGLAWTVNGIAPGRTVDLRFQALVTAAGGTVTNTVAGVTQDQIDTNATADDLDASFTVIGGPGGVGGGLRLWLKADAGVTGGATVSRWADQSGNGNDAAQTVGTRQPTLTADAVNSNPALTFDGVADFLDIPFSSTLNGNDVSVFSVQRLNGGGGSRASLSTLLPGSPDTGYALHALADERYSFVTADALDDGVADSVFEILGLTTSSGSGSAVKDLRINSSVRAMSNVATYAPSASGPYRIGAGGGQLENGGLYWPGDIAEQIVFDTVLSDADRRQVESYLSVKYGISLSQTTPRDLIDSGGNPIFAAREAGTFINNVTGIGRDDNGSLLQSSSRSVNAGSLLTIGNAGDLQDGEFLVWSNEGGALDQTTPVSFAGQTMERVNRIWLVNETGDVGGVDIAVDAADLPGLSPTAGQNYRLILADDPAFTINVEVIDLGATPGMLLASGLQLTHNRCFSFGIDSTAVPTDLFVVKRAEQTTVTEGQVVLFETVVTNNGPGLATGMTITDAIPAGLTYAPGSIGGGDGRADDDPAGGGLTWVIGGLNPGDSVVLSYRAGTDPGTAGTTITSTIDAVTLDQPDTGATPDQPSVDVAIIGPPGRVGNGLFQWLQAGNGADTAADCNGPPAADGGNVQCWAALSGPRLDDAFGSAGPAYATDAINFHPVLRAADATQRIGRLATPGFPATDLTQFIVLRHDASARDEYLYSYATTAQANALGMIVSADGAARLELNGAVSDISGPRLNDGVPHLLRVDLAGGSTAGGAVDGGAAQSSAANFSF